ncbi:MAG: YceI family protein [Opitutales bacterium]|nr:YceI family protein [Opitutales bacterium]
MIPCRSLSLFLVSLVALLVAGCSNPADKTDSAIVADAVEGVKAVANASTYAITAGSSLSFIGSKVTGSQTGGFKSLEGTIAVMGGQIVPPSKVTIDMNLLYSGSDRLTRHLKSADFFDVPNFPTAEFAVTSLQQTASGLEMTGNLTLHGVTKSISFVPEVSVTDSEVSLTAEFDIMRFDFGIAFKGKADDLIRDEVVIALDVKATAE